MNSLKTTMLMALLMALMVALGGIFAGHQGMTVMLVIALGMNFFSYWFSDRMVLSMYHAQEVDRHLNEGCRDHRADRGSPHSDGDLTLTRVQRGRDGRRVLRQPELPRLGTREDRVLCAARRASPRGDTRHGAYVHHQSADGQGLLF